MASGIMANYQAILEQARRVLAERDEGAKIRIQVGSATCENAAGARDVFAEFRNHIEAASREDIVLRSTGCTGRCSREPIVGVFVPGQPPIKYEQVSREKVHRIFTRHVQGGTPVYEDILDNKAETLQRHDFLFCAGLRCGHKRPMDFRQAFEGKLRAAGVSEAHARVLPANCFGLCRMEEMGRGAHILVRPGRLVYRVLTEQDLDRIIHEHVEQGRVVKDLLVGDPTISQRYFELYGDIGFFHRQTRIALRNSGIIDPESIEEYIDFDGFRPLAEVLERGESGWVIDQLKASNLRGRGGGGYPTGLKWASGAEQPGDEKYVICNADEGDPGAFMDRSMLEGDPFSIIEGMAIGAYAIGARQGFLYIRAEYPLAIERIEQAIEKARAHGLLGDGVLGSDFAFDLEVRLGAGAFVCGEETALIHSIEGERGQPRIRPPYPSQSGLWGKPTVINNVETWANIPVVLGYGPDWFRQIGTAKSGGTKVFALAGKVQHTGLIEVPMGSTIREVVFDIGGGVPGGKKLKAVQTGGPAGGVIPADDIDIAVDFETLAAAGSIMGSGGMIVMDEDDCMVDIAKFYLTFSQDESCGKCTPCREGTTRMLEILERITTGRGEMQDLDKLHRLASLIQKTSLCGLGRAAPNPILSTIKHFRDEYEAHVVDKHCPSHKCVSLVRYEVAPDNCVGCTACARNCPVSCIDGKPREIHVIDQSRCIKCGRCYEVCRFDAINRL